MSHPFPRRTLAVLVALGVALPVSSQVAGASAAPANPAMTNVTATAKTSVTAAAQHPAKKKRKRHRTRHVRTARVVLGIHNYQTQNAHTYLARPGVRLTARVNCAVVMSSTRRQMRKIRREREGAPFLLTGCGSSPASWKYRKGPMSGRASDLDADGRSAATPKVRAYVKWLRKIRKTFRRDLGMWEVWNEVDLNNFYRGTPKDLVDLTFAAARVLGRKRVTSPSFSPTVVTGARGKSGAYVHGRFLSRKSFLRSYFRLLVRRADAAHVPLPISVINIHTYGSGLTVRQSARARLIKIKRFKRTIGRLLGRHKLPYWDTEWNLRRIQPVPAVTPMLGFRDSRRNLRVWRKSAVIAACLGMKRQFTYVWEDRPVSDGFAAAQLRMTPQSPYMIQTFRALANKRVRCKR